MENYCILLTRRATSTAVPQVFLAPDSSGPTGWRLPVFVVPHDIYNTDVQMANRLVQEQFGVFVVTRQALRLPDKILGGPLNIYVMEMQDKDVKQTNQSPMTNPKDGKWFDLETVRSFDFAVPTERAVLTAWLDEVESDTLPSLRLSWWREGWFQENSEWLQTRTVALGRTPLAPVEQLRSASTSALLRILTDDGYLYLKTVPAPFAQPEVALTEMLAQRDPTHFPKVLTAESDRLLLADFGSHRPLDGDIPLAQWEEVVRFYAQLQTSSVGSIPHWLSLGCADLRISQILAHLDELISQVPDRLHGLPQQLSSEELTCLRALSVPLRAQCDELSRYGIPDALEHGDLHAGNIAVDQGDFLIYDWSHACVTHPFYGLGSLLLDDDWFLQEPEAVPRLRDAYLEAWTEYASLPRLQVAFALWSRLRPLFLAVHQSNVVAAYQDLLGGQDHFYVPETATGNALQYMQWWLASHWRTLLNSFAVSNPNP